MAQCREDFIDFAENKLMERISEGDTTSIIFALKCLGKDRGYVERAALEVSGANGGALKAEIQQQKPDLSKLTDEELEAYAALSAKARGDTVPAPG
jgi:hypothetical protein